MTSLFRARSNRWISGHRVTLLKNGGEIVPAMLAAIEAATTAVHLEAYIFRGDATGRRFADALARGAARGLSVYVIYDALGSLSTPREFFDQLKSRGVAVLEYHPLSPWNPGWRFKRRDHRKVMVIDGRIAFVGGMNVGDEYADPSDGGGGWRDTQVKVEGPAVAILERAFRRTWNRQVLMGPRRISETPTPPDRVGDVAVAILVSWGKKRRNPVKRAYLDAIRRARVRIDLCSAYFVPPPRILWALKMAARRGVQIRLLVPARSDVRLVDYASRAVYGRLLHWGVRIFEWQGPVLHAKTAVIDGSWSTVGSYNMDFWSFLYNLEANALIDDPTFAREMEAMFEDDLRHSREVVEAEWRQRHPVRKALESSLYYLLAWM